MLKLANVKHFDRHMGQYFELLALTLQASHDLKNDCLSILTASGPLLSGPPADVDQAWGSSGWTALDLKVEHPSMHGGHGCGEGKHPDGKLALAHHEGPSLAEQARSIMVNAARSCVHMSAGECEAAHTVQSKLT